MVGNDVGFSETIILFGCETFLLHNLQMTEEQEKANYSLSIAPRWLSFLAVILPQSYFPLLQFPSRHATTSMYKILRYGNKNEKNITRWFQAALCEATLGERRESCDINHIIFWKENN